MPRLLIAEDNLEVRSALVDLLRIEGYEVVGVENGSEALAHLRQADTLPDAILLDLMMPDISGWDFLEQRRQDERLLQVPVILLSGVEVDPEDEAFPDVWAVLKKPLLPSEILSTIERCVQRLPNGTGAPAGGTPSHR